MADVEVEDEKKVQFENGPHPDFSTASGATSGPLQKKKSSLRSSSKKRQGGSSVSFLETVTVRELPSEEAEEAKSTRKGAWESAPEHDELWDGHTRDFWEKEKTMEEVRRIVVVRQMRMALQYNLGYAFYSMVANFKKRRPAVENNHRGSMSGDEDVVPQFETPGAEETAIRKEIRELFADSVKGLDFPDLVQDREAFDKIYSTTVIGISDAKRAPGLGLLRIEELVDEIMNTAEICRMLGVQFIERESPEKGKAELEAQEKIDNAVGVEEKRRGERRASIEAQNNGIPVFAERRLSVEAKRRASIEALAQPPPENAQSGNARRASVEAKPANGSEQNGRRGSIQSSETVPERRSSLQERRPSLQGNVPNENAIGSERRPSIQGERRASLQGNASAPVITERRPSLQGERRASLQPTPAAVDADDDTPIFASGGRSAVIASQPVRTPSATRVVVDGAAATKDSFIVHSLKILLGLLLVAIMSCIRAFQSNPNAEGRPNVKGGGPLVWLVPLAFIFGVTMLVSTSGLRPWPNMVYST